MKSSLRSILGGGVWLGVTLRLVPNLFANAWAHAVVLFAALVIAPLAFDLIEAARRNSRVGLLQFAAGLLLAGAFLTGQGWTAAGLALPWTALTIWLAVEGVRDVKALGLGASLERLGAAIALVFLGVGGLWVLADRAGLRPLGFDGEIVALTAAHFHYAGLLLPLAAGLVWRRTGQTRLASRAVVGVVLGVPAVALGITGTQLGWGPGVECAAGCWLALSGMAVAVLHVRLATEPGAPLVVRALWGVAGVSLFFGMLLAGCYAMRAFAAPIPWLGLAWMRALHGTMNAFGFGLCGVLAWRADARAAAGRVRGAAGTRRLDRRRR